MRAVVTGEPVYWFCHRRRVGTDVLVVDDLNRVWGPTWETLDHGHARSSWMSATVSLSRRHSGLLGRSWCFSSRPSPTHGSRWPSRRANGGQRTGIVTVVAAAHAAGVRRMVNTSTGSPVRGATTAERWNGAAHRDAKGLPPCREWW
jgi:hypothetical protein